MILVFEGLPVRIKIQVRYLKKDMWQIYRLQSKQRMSNWREYAIDSALFRDCYSARLED